MDNIDNNNRRSIETAEIARKLAYTMLSLHTEVSTVSVSSVWFILNKRQINHLLWVLFKLADHLKLANSD